MAQNYPIVYAESPEELLEQPIFYMWSSKYLNLSVDSILKELTAEEKKYVYKINYEQVGKGGFKAENYVQFPFFVPISLLPNINDNAHNVLVIQKKLSSGEVIKVHRADQKIVEAKMATFKGFVAEENWPEHIRECFDLFIRVRDRLRKGEVNVVGKFVRDWKPEELKEAIALYNKRMEKEKAKPEDVEMRVATGDQIKAKDEKEKAPAKNKKNG